LLKRAAISVAILFLCWIVAGELDAAIERGKFLNRNMFLGQPDRLAPTSFWYTVNFFGRLRAGPVDQWYFQVGLLTTITGVFGVAFVFFPLILRLIAAAQSRWRTGYTMAALGLAVAGLAGFILYFGNRQFGGFDHSILVGVGWRLFQGQVPYRDFVCPLSPGFFLGVKYAFQLFGVHWTSILLMAAILAAGSFLWMYFLLRALLESPLAAFLTALSVQCATTILLSFWWYNNVTTVAATLFFLSCLLYLKQGERIGAQVSFVASLALTGLVKPNTAALVIFFGVVLLFLATPSKTRFLALSVAATAVALAILAVNHVGVAGMISSYFVVVRDRGQVATEGIDRMRPEDRARAVLFLAALISPYLAWWPQFREAIRAWDRRRMAFLLLLLSAPFTGAVAMSTNGEFKDVDWPMIICSGVMLLHEVLRSPRFGAWWRILVRVYACALLALAFADLDMGATRYRVMQIGNHRFFEWREPFFNPGTSFFPGMRASPQLRDALSSIAQVLHEDPGSVFLGPRLEFAYAVFGLPAPQGLPIWWDPGTAFTHGDEPAMIEAWRQRHFKTVILLAGDSTYYPPPFVKLINATYEPDIRWDTITVLHRK
jgi:hypothetical protein